MLKHSSTKGESSYKDDPSEVNSENRFFSLRVIRLRMTYEGLPHRSLDQWWGLSSKDPT